MSYKAGNRGDTIIEVLIAIAVAAFALGTSYAIANKSLQRAISARERNQSTNIIQSQIASLKNREQKASPTSFTSNFTTSSTLPVNFKHFCLDESPSAASDQKWDNSNPTGASPLTSPNPYSSNCVRTPNGTNYYIDIVAMATSKSPSRNPTIYQVNVRWIAVGSGATNQATVYYRF